MTARKPLPVDLIDALLADYKNLIGEEGLLRQLTKALVERALNAEMTDQTFWHIRKEICGLVATQFPSQAFLAIGVYAMKLKSVFCQVNADHGNSTHGMASFKKLELP